MILKIIVKSVLLILLTIVAFIAGAVIASNVVAYPLTLGFAAAMLIGAIAFKFLSVKKTIIFLVGLLLVMCVLLPKAQQAALTPYVEMVSHDIRDQIDAIKKSGGPIPRDISQMFDDSARKFGGTGVRYRILKARPYKYNSETGEFTIEYF
jgi:hypothetical protein